MLCIYLFKVYCSTVYFNCLLSFAFDWLNYSELFKVTHDNLLNIITLLALVSFIYDLHGY